MYIFFMFRRLFSYQVDRYKTSYDREKYENILKDPNNEIGQKLNAFIAILVITSVLIIILESVEGIRQEYHIEMFIAEILISLVFAVEYVYRLLRAKNKIFFLKRAVNIIDLLSFAPFFLGLVFHIFAGTDILKVLRLFKILRLFEISTRSPIALGFMRTLREYRREYKAILAIFLSIMIVISTLVYYFENGTNPDFSSIPAAFWWGIVTMTTVWYGDMVPITIGGKVFGSLIILLWPVLLAIISSISILVFMDVADSQKQIVQKACTKCRTKNREDSNYCYHCGHTHFLNEVHEKKTVRKAIAEKLFSLK